MAPKIQLRGSQAKCDQDKGKAGRRRNEDDEPSQKSMQIVECELQTNEEQSRERKCDIDEVQEQDQHMIQHEAPGQKQPPETARSVEEDREQDDSRSHDRAKRPGRTQTRQCSSNVSENPAPHLWISPGIIIFPDTEATLPTPNDTTVPADHLILPEATRGADILFSSRVEKASIPRETDISTDGQPELLNGLEKQPRKRKNHRGGKKRKGAKKSGAVESSVVLVRDVRAKIEDEDSCAFVTLGNGEVATVQNPSNLISGFKTLFSEAQRTSNDLSDAHFKADDSNTCVANPTASGDVKEDIQLDTESIAAEDRNTLANDILEVLHDAVGRYDPVGHDVDPGTEIIAAAADEILMNREGAVSTKAPESRTSISKHSSRVTHQNILNAADHSTSINSSTMNKHSEQDMDGEAALVKQHVSGETEERGINANKPVTQSKSEPAPYKIRDAPGKGKGLFATKNIARGSRIMAESPLFLLADKGVTEIPIAVASLSSTQQQTLFELSSDWPMENILELTEWMKHLQSFDVRRIVELKGMSPRRQAIAIAIVETNAHTTGAGSGLFPEASRINHSCIPNVYHSWNTALGKTTIHAIRDIEAGEELLTTYIPLLLARQQRHDEQHLGHYGFQCKCQACDLSAAFGAQSQERRQWLALCDQQVSCAGDPPLKYARGEVVPDLVYVTQIARERVFLLHSEMIANMDLCRW